MKKNNTRKLTTLAILTAIVIVLQILAIFLRTVGFAPSLVLVPVVLGAALFGPVAGAWLGFVFGLAVLISGDAATFLTINAFGTVLVVLLKGTLAGFAAGIAYKLLEKLNKTVAVFAAAVVCPLVNTGIFLLGSLVFFLDTIKAWAIGGGFGENWGTYMIVGLVGINFLFELILNVVLSPVVVRLIDLAKKKH
jgi:uncharacterized membrane protein